MLNDYWSKQPMAQFFVMRTAKATYLMTYTDQWSWMWGYTKPIKELERNVS